MGIIRQIFGNRNDRQLRRLRPLVQQINEYKTPLHNKKDDQLKTMSAALRERAQSGESLTTLLPETFALVREAATRTIDMTHYDVQLLGGIALHKGHIAEMGTGEGKTLVATLSISLNALMGQGVHLVTVNHYLAERDAQWMRPLYEFLGLSLGVILPDQPREEREAAYRADITYGTNNEFGFDYLRDNMVFRHTDKVQRGHYYAIIDEVDSILIDEARTPLIISGAAADSSRLYRHIDRLATDLYRRNAKENIFTVDEKQRQVELTEEGHQKVENWLTQQNLLQKNDSLYAPSNLNLLHHVQSALRAYTLFNKDIEYIVQADQVVLIDEHTGRTMPGRRLSEGLHQAIEAKERVTVQHESQTLASITFQNYFRQYDKLAGMTGTADTEAAEFHQIYNLDVLVIPPNKPTQRTDRNDLVYMTTQEKMDAIIKSIKECMSADAPVLVGTASIETSELLSALLKKNKIVHKVLNAKYHRQEAEIIAQAGIPKTVTIATNMAGRGTDTILGGNPNLEIAKINHDDPQRKQKEEVAWQEWQQQHDRVIAAGGLHILGTERHESRRIDNQLRGRAGRQGDPGATRFYISLEDDLMRIFASERVKGFMQGLGMEKDEPIEHRMVTNAIERAQKKIENRNFNIRKRLLEYDDVANEQRQVIYQQRNELLFADNLSDSVASIRHEVITQMIAQYIPPELAEQWDIPLLEKRMISEFGLQLPIQQWTNTDDEYPDADQLNERIQSAVTQYWHEKIAPLQESASEFEKYLMLNVLDMHWKTHLNRIDHLRHSIHLRAYAQRNPMQEYKRESFSFFAQMLQDIKYEFVRAFMRIRISADTALQQENKSVNEQNNMQLQHQSTSGYTESNSERSAKPQTSQRVGKKIGRNDPCPCGSGKKYKHCHGRTAPT